MLIIIFLVIVAIWFGINEADKVIVKNNAHNHAGFIFIPLAIFFIIIFILIS